MTIPAPTFLDLEDWPRRATFDYFRSFDKPYFNVCTRLDVSRLKPAVADAGVGSLALASYFLAIQMANEVASFRYRLEAGRVRIHGVVHGSTTVLRDDQSLGFARLEHAGDFAAFASGAAQAIDAARLRSAPFEPTSEETDVIHLTTLPWIHFTSFSHARNWGQEDAIPKLAFGRIEAEGARLWLPLSVEVHHALMDGLHLGQFIEGFEAALADPRPWLAKRR